MSEKIYEYMKKAVILLWCYATDWNKLVISSHYMNRTWGMKAGGFGAVKSYSTHHFFGNACTKSGSLRFSQFSGCWLILSVYFLLIYYTNKTDHQNITETLLKIVSKTP
jgi:hypothetical protein